MKPGYLQLKVMGNAPQKFKAVTTGIVVSDVHYAVIPITISRFRVFGFRVWSVDKGEEFCVVGVDGFLEVVMPTSNGIIHAILTIQCALFSCQNVLTQIATRRY